MKLPTLYKQSRNGAILQWSIETDGPNYWSTHGMRNGKLIIDTPTAAEIKNPGRANERSAEDQAIFEATNRHKAHLEHQGYSTDLAAVLEGDAAGPDYFMPTLAVVENHKHMPQEIYISPKLDGLRCVITKDGAFTRRGKRYVSTKFIEEDLKEVFEQNPNLVLDGELYNHALKDDFNKITSLARKAKASSISQADWETIRDVLQIHIFDFKDESAPDIPFSERYKILQKLAGITKRAVIVEQHRTVLDPMFIKYAHDEYCKDGYEGAMIRDPLDPYIHDRTKKLQKVKIFIDAEFPVVDFTPGKGKMGDIAARVTVRLKNGETCDAGINGTHEYCRELLKNKDQWIGKLATIKFQNYTPAGKLRFAKMIDLGREDV